MSLSAPVSWEDTGTRAFVAGFEVLAELGRGATSTVLRVRRPDGAQYALKILDQAASTGEQALVGFRREAALLATVDHPGLATVHEVGQHDGRAYLVLDLVDGSPLAEVLRRGAMRPQAVVDLARDLLGPLTAAHRRGLVHRDLKPDNVMMTPTGQARLIDFGLATRETGGAAAAVGTLAYSPPEQTGVLQRPVDHRSDLYSLGVVLFESLTGVLPFTAVDVGELLRMHAVTTAPDVRSLIPGIGSGLAAVVATLLAKDPDDRYADGEQLAADLDLLADDPLAAVDPRRARPGAGGPVSVPLSGRSGELARLVARWEAARAGSGGVCVVRGAAGAGKSRVAAELASRVAEQGAVVLSASCTDDDPVPLTPLRSAFESHLASLDLMPQQQRDVVLDRFREAAGPAAGVVASLTPALEETLGAALGELGQDQFTLAFAGFLGALARSAGGLLLVVDDVQWADPGTALVLSQLVKESSSAPLLVLLTARDDPASDVAVRATVGADRGFELELPALDETGVADLVRAALPALDADASLVRLVSSRSKGNPFVAHEYLRAIVEAGLLCPSWGRWLVDEEALDALDLPSDVLRLVVKRVDGLGEQVRGLLVTAAAIGTRFDPELVAAVDEVPVAVVLASLAEAAARGLLEVRAHGDFAFLHERVRGALLEDLDAMTVARLHRRIAEALEATAEPVGGRDAAHVYAVARHHVAGRAAGADAATGGRAFAACWAAGRLALAEHAPTESVAFLRHAAEETAEPDSAFLLTLGTALQVHGEYAEARERLEQALDREQAPVARGRILVHLAEVHRATWRMDRSATAVEQGLAELGASVPASALRSWLSTAVMCLATLTGRWLGGRPARRSRDREGDRLRWEVIAGLHEAGAYVAILRLRRGDVVLHILRGLYWASRVGVGTQYARTRATFGFLCGQAGLRRTARRVLAGVAADADGSDPRMQALVGYYHGATMYVGNHDDGQAWAEGTTRDGLLLDLSSFCDAVCNIVTEAVFQGRTDEATSWLETAQRRQALRGEDVTAMIFAESMVAALTGRPTEAAASFDRSEALLRDDSPVVITTLSRLTALILLCEQDETGRPFDEAVARFDELDLRPSAMLRGQQPVHFYIARGRLTQCRRASEGDRPLRLEAAKRAVRRVASVAGCPVMRAHLLVLQADLLVLESKPQDALAILNGVAPAYDPDSPLLAYEAARVRARALAALGAVGAARRQVVLAHGIARDSGWPHRADWVAAELQQAGGSVREATGVLSTQHARTLTGTRTGRADELSGLLSSQRQAGLEHQRLQALEQISAAAARVLDPGTLARICLDETIRVLRADRAFLFLCDDTGDLVPHLGRDAGGADVPELTGYSASLVERVRRTGEPLVVTGTEEGAAPGGQSVVLHGLRSIMAAPLQLDGRLLGVVYLDSQVAKGIFSAEDAGILTALTNHIATSLETARAAQLQISVQTARRERDLADTLRAALQAMSDTFDPAQVLTRLLHWAPALLSCDTAWIVDVDAGDSCSLASLDEAGALVTRVVASEPELGDLLAIDRPVDDALALVPTALGRLMPGTVTAIAVPLRSREADLGVLVLATSSCDVLLGDRVELASALVAQAMTAYDRATLFAVVQSLAVADELTGIANRRRFFEVADRDVARASRSGQRLSALMIDIDHFKRVNDSHGHPTGDDVIRTVAQRLAAEIRSTDFIGRYGGEEFAVVLPDADLTDGLPERLRACIALQPVPSRTGPLDITVSIGLATLRPEDADTADLLARADRALYRAKVEGRNRVHAD